MTIPTPQMSVPLNTGSVDSIILSFEPTISTIPNFVGQEVWARVQNTYWKNVGFTVGVGYLWVQIFPTSTTPSQGITWSTVTVSGVVMQAESGYYLNNSAAITMTINGSGFVQGSIIQIIASLAFAGVTINVSGSQSIVFGSNQTSANGSLANSAAGSTIMLTCVVPNSVWVATGSNNSAWKIS